MLTVGLVLAGTTGCGGGAASPGEPSGTSEQSSDGVQVERRTWGGMCPEGPCTSDFAIASDGSWTLETEATSATGTLPPEDVAALAAAVRSTSLERATGEVSCAADADGTSVEYTWLYGGTEHRVSSCEHPFDSGDVLVVAVEDILARTQG